MTILGVMNLLAEPTASPSEAAASFNFEAVNFPDGFPVVDQINIVEPVTSNGVDNSRLRIVRRDYQKFVFMGLSSTPTYGEAVTLARAMRKGPGRRANFTVTCGGIAYDFTAFTFYVHSSMAHPRAGQVTQAGTALQGAYVDSRFELQRVL